MTGPRPSRDQALLRSALLWAERSTCLSGNVGAVIARDGRILVQGYNGAPAGMPHCRPEDHPPHTLTCAVSVHAEANAIIWAARTGVRLEGAELFSTHSPCLHCAQLIVNAGIARVVAVKMYRLPEGWHYLNWAGVATMLMDVV